MIRSASAKNGAVTTKTALPEDRGVSAEEKPTTVADLERLLVKKGIVLSADIAAEKKL